MRYPKLILVIFATILTTSTGIFVARAEDKGAKIEFAESCHNIGTIERRSDNRHYSFHFKNSGNEPLVILSATTSCSCIKATFSRKPIPAGESGKVCITIEPRKVEKGIFHRIVQIHSNAINGTTILTLEGIVK